MVSSKYSCIDAWEEIRKGRRKVVNLLEVVTPLVGGFGKELGRAGVSSQVNITWR